MGTMLFQRGLRRGACPEVWNVERPEVVRAITREYVEAGADIVTTNTFGANRAGLHLHHLASRLSELNVAGVELARAAGASLVMGSIGPALRPNAAPTRDEARAPYAEQARALDYAGVDAMVLETFTDLDEILAALSAVKATTKMPVFATMSCCPGRRSLNVATAAEVARVLATSGAEAIGVNCNAPDECLPVLLEMRVAVETPLVAQPHAGLPRVVGEAFVYDLTPTTMADYAVRFRDLGVNIIGGCCGTTPEHIRAMAKVSAQS